MTKGWYWLLERPSASLPSGGRRLKWAYWPALLDARCRNSGFVWKRCRMFYYLPVSPLCHSKHRQTPFPRRSCIICLRSFLHVQFGSPTQAHLMVGEVHRAISWADQLLQAVCISQSFHSAPEPITPVTLKSAILQRVWAPTSYLSMQPPFRGLLPVLNTRTRAQPDRSIVLFAATKFLYEATTTETGEFVPIHVANLCVTTHNGPNPQRTHSPRYYPK